ncbi:uncharacterized protein LOC111357895 [Spodoptera litura]|uniref:Uncharacterized protein LOC111357895 n=1 Tax=Spodoptera litura TaxID=69820 RepID=A0A9J7EDR2_SPOLT|nr:uncharacterized protein LOC111357895 [Spodoptera litura]
MFRRLSEVDAVPLKLIPGERNVIKDKGVTHTISRFYVVPEDFGEGTTVKALRSDLGSSETSETEDSTTEDLLERVEDEGSSIDAYKDTNADDASSTTNLLRTTVTTVLTKSNVMNETDLSDLSHLLVQPARTTLSMNSSVSWNPTRAGEEETHDQTLTETTVDNDNMDAETSLRVASDDHKLEGGGVIVSEIVRSGDNVDNATSSDSISQQVVDDSAITADSLSGTTILTGDSNTNINEGVLTGSNLYVVKEDVENVEPIVYALDDQTITNENNSRSLQHPNLEGMELTNLDATDLPLETGETSNLRSRINGEYTDPWSIVSKMGNGIVWTKEDKTIKDVPWIIKKRVYKKDNDDPWIILERIKNGIPWQIGDKKDNDGRWTIVKRIESDLPWHTDDKKDNDIPLQIKQMFENYIPRHTEDTTNSGLWTTVERIKNGLPWNTEDKIHNNIPWTVVQRIKSYLPGHIEYKKQNDVPLKIVEKVNYIPEYTEDKKHNDIPWTILEKIKSGLPWHIEDETDNGDRETIVERDENYLPSNIEDKTDNDGRETIVQEVKNDLPLQIEDKTVNDGRETIVQEVKNDLPLQIEDKTVNDGRETIVQEVKNDLPLQIEDKTVNDGRETIVQEVKNDLPLQIEDKTVNDGRETIVQEVKNDLPLQIEDKTVNDGRETIVQEVKNDLPLQIEDKTVNDGRETIVQEVKNDLPLQIEDKTVNDGRETIVQEVKNDLPLQIEDKTDNDDRETIVEEDKSYLPLQIEDITDNDDRRTIVEEVENYIPSYIQDTTEDNVPSETDERVNNDIPKHIEDAMDNDDLNIADKLKNEIPSQIEDKTDNNFPYVVNIRDKNNMPWLNNDKTDNDYPETIVETVKDDLVTIEEKIKKDILSTIKHLPLTDKTIDYNLPGTIEDRIKEDILSTLEGKWGTNQPWTIKKKTSYNLPLIIEDKLGDTNYIVKKKIYNNIPWTSGDEIVGTGPWHISQLPTLSQSPTTSSKQDYTIKKTSKQPYHVYTYVVHPPAVEASPVSHEKSDLDNILNVKSTKYSTKLEPGIDNIYKLSAVSNPTGTVHVNKPITYELQHNIGTSPNTVVPETLQKYSYNIESDVAPKTAQNEIHKVYSDVISQNPQDHQPLPTNQGSTDPKITYEYIETNVVTPKTPHDYSLNLIPGKVDPKITHEVTYSIDNNVDTPKTPLDESLIIEPYVISQNPQSYTLNLISGSNNPKVSHEYVYKVKSQIPTHEAPKEDNNNVYSGVIPHNLQDYQLNVNPDIVNPEVTHEYTYNIETNAVTPKTPQDYNLNTKADAVYSTNKDIVTPVTYEDRSSSIYSDNVVPNTPQNYNLNINSGVTPETPVDYSDVQKGPQDIKPRPDHNINLPTDFTLLNLPKKQLLHQNPQYYKLNLEVTKQHPNEDQKYLYENVVKRPADISNVKPENFDYYQTPNLELAPTYKLFTLQNLLKLTDGLKKQKLSVGLNSQEQNALNNLLTVLEILLIQADYFGKQNDWYEKIFYDVPPQSRHPLQLYAYHLIRQRWLHDLLLLLHKNNFDLNIFRDPRIISHLESWKFPEYVQNYLEAEHILGKKDILQHDIVPLNHQVVNNNGCQHCAVDLENYVAKHVLHSPKNERLILNIAGVDVEVDAGAVKGILQKYLLNKNAIEDQENVIMQDNKTEMLKQIILYLKHKGYKTEVIFDLIQKLNGAVFPTPNKGCDQQASILQNIYDDILPTLRRSLE